MWHMPRLSTSTRTPSAVTSKTSITCECFRLAEERLRQHLRHRRPRNTARTAPAVLARHTQPSQPEPHHNDPATHSSEFNTVTRPRRKFLENLVRCDSASRAPGRVEEFRLENRLSLASFQSLS